MAIEIVFNETLENVEAAVHGALADCGFRVRPSPMAPGVEVKAKMAFWLGEKGNGLLSLVLPFLFKTDSVAAVLAAYQDGTTALTLRPNSSYGGNLAGGVVSIVNRGTGLGSSAAGKADVDRKAEALVKQLSEIETKLRTRLGSKVAYEGPVRSDVQQVMA
jgi:hypothetical protein